MSSKILQKSLHAAGLTRHLRQVHNYSKDETEKYCNGHGRKEYVK